MFVCPLLLCCDSLVCSDGNHHVYILYRASAREVVYRTCDTLEYGTDSLGMTKTLNELVTDVSCTEVGEYEYVGFACYC